MKTNFSKKIKVKRKTKHRTGRAIMAGEADLSDTITEIKGHRAEEVI